MKNKLCSLQRINNSTTTMIKKYIYIFSLLFFGDTAAKDSRVGGNYIKRAPSNIFHSACRAMVDIRKENSEFSKETGERVDTKYTVLAGANLLPMDRKISCEKKKNFRKIEK